MDVKTAFLHGDLKEDIFISIPDGFNKIPNMVCKLNKTLYGLKQSPREWNYKFDSYIKSLNFENLESKYCLYVKKGLNPIDNIYILLFVDDLIIACKSYEHLLYYKSKLLSQFKMVDIGELKYFLGIEIYKK